jgi:hypothetical protein
MNANTKTALTISIGLVCLMAMTASATESVSPGAFDRMAQVNNACPTFSWGMTDNAMAYEVVAYSLSDDASQEEELGADSEVLFSRVAGSATSWTPSADRCFAPGGRFVWFVRAVTELDGDEVIMTGEWSAGRYFTVPVAPSPEDVARAIEVMRWLEGSSGSQPSMVSSGTGTATETVSGNRAGVRNAKSIPTASAAIRGENPSLNGEGYGVVGISSAQDGAGIAAAHLDGGPDLVLDGSAEGDADALFWEWGMDRHSAVDESFSFSNTGAGAMTLDIEGTLAADGLDCPDCVTSASIENLSITGADLANGSVLGTKIADGAVGSVAIHNNAVTNAHLVDDAVTSAEILDGTITPDDVDQTKGFYVSKSQLYEREEEATFGATITVSVSAACDDTNDLPLAGSCEINPSNQMNVRGQWAENWTGAGSPAEWTCLFENTSGTTYTAYARILCIAVP